MATQVFLMNTDVPATTHRGTNTAKQNTSTSGWRPLATSTSRGAGAATSVTNTVTGPTSGIESEVGGFPSEWLTPPVDQNVTISGTITGNIWAHESSMNANVAINFRVDKVAATDGTLTTIATSARTTELGTATAVNNFTVSPTSTALNKGDRLRIVVFGDDSTAAMASGFTFTVTRGGTTAAADGDTYITFNETFGFQTTDPTGTTLYLTNTASAVATADDDRETWTSQLGGFSSVATSTANGWTAPIQMTNGAGGTALSWFSKPLTAFTLSGLVQCQVRASASNAAANASVGVQIARVDNDGTNATVWGYATRDAATTNGSAGEMPTGANVNQTVYVAGDDLDFTAGQRLRIRLFLDDCADVPLVTGFTGSFTSTTGGESLATKAIFGQTLTESTPGTAFPFRRVDRSAPLRDTDPWSLTGWRS